MFLSISPCLSASQMCAVKSLTRPAHIQHNYTSGKVCGFVSPSATCLVPAYNAAAPTTASDVACLRASIDPAR